MKDAKSRDWSDVAAGIGEGNPVAIVAVSRVVIGFLIRARAYDVRDSWDDLCQDVLLALVRNQRQGRLRDPDAFVAYVGAITRNKLADALRVQRGRRASGHELERLVGPVASLQDDALSLDLREALALLGARQRRVIQAIYLEGHSYEDAAERLGLPLGTLKRLQTGALRAIRLRLLVEPPTRRPRLPATVESSELP